MMANPFERDRMFVSDDDREIALKEMKEAGRLRACISMFNDMHIMRRNFVDDLEQQAKVGGGTAEDISHGPAQDIAGSDFQEIEQAIWRVALKQNPSIGQIAQFFQGASHDFLKVILQSFYDQAGREKDKKSLDAAVAAAKAAIHSRKTLDKDIGDGILAALDTLKFNNKM